MIDDRTDSRDRPAMVVRVVVLSLLSCRSRVLVLEAEVFRRDLKKLDFCVGLAEVFDERFDHVADAGSLGGGMVSYRSVSTSLPDRSDNFASLIFL